MEAIYLDNAATSFPKPAGVSDRMKYYLDCVGANVNRSVYTAAQEAGLVTLTLRQRLAQLFDFPEPPTHVILTSGATAGLNMIISGLLRPGDHCIVSSMEHNAVMRPLLRLPGVAVSRVPCDAEGFADLDALPGLFRENTRLVIMAHGSNVCGAVQDATAIGRICTEKGVPFALDAAQTAGAMLVDVQALGIDVLCFTGHKALLGPQGTGGLYVRPGLQVAPLVVGGSGVYSFDEHHPTEMPTALEAGTLNVPGIAGLGAGVRWLLTQGVEALETKENALARLFYETVREIPGVWLYGDFTAPRAPIVSLNLAGEDSARVADALWEEYGICVRAGAHCAPLMHRALGTVEQGVVRFSLSHTNTRQEALAAARAVRSLAEE